MADRPTRNCNLCDDTGYKDYAGFAMDPCDHQQPYPVAHVMADLLTKAVGDITAALILAGKEDKIARWTAPYVEALNGHDAIAALQARSAEPEQDQPIWRVEVLEGANSHVFDLRLCIDGDEAQCIAFADDPWATRIAYALRHAEPAGEEPVAATIGDIPEEIAAMVLQIGRAQWGQTEAFEAEGHAAHIAESVRLTDENFGQTGPRHMHGLYIEDTGTVICHTGTSPNSPQIARALTGAWNWLHIQATQSSDAQDRGEGHE
ncbi:hypothetical protein [Novosphingobium sp.]|uniref:hypothetical protein n=1 Tax=Novosphingobium sp. TaxID=1874826 RepID=UPI003D6CF475